jgi:Ca2+-binding EF-hand superfamily protein
MTIQGIGSSYIYTSSLSSSYTSSETEESAGFEIPAPTVDVTEIMEQDDANSDGVLTLEETALSQELFSSADADGDGELSSEELEEMLASAPPPPMGGAEESDDDQDADSIMENDDANSDGVLTIDETPLTEEMFATADEDGDGELSSEELEAYVTSAPGAGAGLAGAEDSEEDEEDYSAASTTASMIMDAYETASFNSLFSQSEDENSYANLFSGLVI